MKRSFLANLAFLLFLNLVVKPVWILGIDRSVQNITGAADYGLYFSLFNFSVLFQVVLDFGFQNYSQRKIAANPGLWGRYMPALLVAKALFALGYVVLVGLFAMIAGYSQDMLPWLGLLIVNQVLMSFFLFLRSQVAALQQFRTDAWLSVSDKAVSGILCALIMFTDLTPFTMSIPVFLYTQMAGFIISIIAATISLVAATNRSRLTWQPALLKEIVHRSAPYALLTFLMAAYYRLDGVMLERLLGQEGPYQAGVYASAFRLVDAVTIIGYLFAAILLPQFARMLELKESVSKLLELGTRAMSSIMIPIICCFYIYSTDIMPYLYQAATPQYARVLSWLLPGLAGISVVYIFGSLLTARGDLRILNLIAASGLILNLVLNLWLIPVYQAEGAAMATLITQLSVAALHIGVVYQRLPIQTDYQIWLKVGLLLLVSLGTAFAARSLWPQQVIGVLPSLMLSFTVALGLGLVRTRDLRPALSEQGG